MYPGNLYGRYSDLYFTTATVKGWKHLLKPDKYKKIITDSFEFLVKEHWHHWGVRLVKTPSAAANVYAHAGTA